MNRILRTNLVLVLVGTNAAAQYCPPWPIPGACNPALQGNPLDTRNGSSFDTTTDFTYRTSLLDFDFERRFISNSVAWSSWGSQVWGDILGPVPVPFGKGPSGTGLRMWHTLYSMASHSSTVWTIRDTRGYQTEFQECSPGPGTGSECWAVPTVNAPSIRARLKLVRVSPTVVAPTLIQPDGLVLNYRADRTYATDPLFFLSSVERYDDGSAPTSLLSVTYFGSTQAPTLPPGFTANACPTLAVQGIPFIKEVSFAPASNHKLYFEYGVEGTGSGQQCVLKRVLHHRIDGIDSTLVTYAYVNNVGGYPELASRANNSTGTVTEAYSYDNGFARYAFSANQGLITSKFLDPVSFKITSSTGGGPHRLSVVNQASSTTCSVLGASTCCNPASPLETNLITQANTGDGTNTPTQLLSTYYSMPGAGRSTHDMVLFRKTDAFNQGNALAVSPGTEDWIWRDTSGGNCPSANGTQKAVLWAFKNKRGAYTVTPHALSSSTLPEWIERTAKQVGATDSWGLNALESESYAYSYGPVGEQRLSQVKRPSALDATAEATTATTYSGTRVTSVITEGKTRNLNGVTLPRWIGTFYRTARSCFLPGSDALNRTVRVEGPCDVSSLSATACSQVAFPVTEFVYDPGGTSDNQNGRLLVVKRYPNFTTGACGSALTTNYTDYSPEGLPKVVVDESGSSRAFQYSGQLVTSIVEGTSTTAFEYEGSRLTKTTFPMGNYERACYRSGADAACVGGTLTDKVQWRAKYDTGGTWTERIDYFYANYDGTLSREVFSTNNAGASDAGTSEMRFDKLQERDAHQRLAFEQVGSGSGSSMRTMSAFDAANNRIATSIPFAHTTNPFVYAPAFCANNSMLCRWMQYDFADRLTQMDVHPDASTSTPSQRTCLEYDKQGNVRRVTGGCATSDTCPNNVSSNVGSATPCSQAYADYEVDDFGNTVAVVFPWTGSTSARGTTRYEYDALGNVTKKQTAAMAAAGTYLLSGFDQTGRLLGVALMPSGQLLYRLGYDSDEIVEAGCPILTYGDGRLTVREDSFGTTWYLYDQVGRVTSEVRRRYGMTGCGGGAAQDKNPSTTYSYNANGALTAIAYPHGRTVEYVYPSTGAMDRPTSINYTTWNGSAWSLPTPLIDSIKWEPYGELRAYRFVATGQWVEYLKQGSLETAPTSATCAGLSATGWGATDGSGRLRGLFVSDGAFALGLPNGNILKQVYTWVSDQVVKQHTCHRNGGSPFVEDFAYDLLPRLTSKAELGLASTYGYDRRNNRRTTDLAGPFACSQVADWWSASWQLDLPFSTKWGPAYGTTCNASLPASGKYNYWYDSDGRRMTTWDETTLYSVQTNYPLDKDRVGFDGVFQSATVTGGGSLTGSYLYFYDAFSRRRAKTTAWSTVDEYFYDTGHQMLSDRGGNNVGSSATEFPEDDYVWLGGRPVAIIRSKFSPSTWQRTADGPTNWCYRNGEAAVCGTFMLVTDYLGKPVAMFDRGGTSGTATYEGFGFANRRPWRYGSPHNQQTTNLTLTTITPQLPPDFDGPLRLLLSRSSFSNLSSLTLAGVSQTGLQGNQAHAWSAWQYASGNSWPVVWNGNAADYGVDIEAYEVRAKQWGVWWGWTPLRYPGQYYDPETELNENWNRYYDPSTGRYLSPEPMLQDPTWVKDEAQDGFSAPTYAYARNNPVKYTDPTGLCASTYDCCLEKNPGNPAACGGFRGPKPFELPEFDPKSLLKPATKFVEDVCAVVSVVTMANTRRCYSYQTNCLHFASSSICQACADKCVSNGGTWPPNDHNGNSCPKEARERQP